MDRDLDLACRILIWLLKDIDKYDKDHQIPDTRQMVYLIAHLYHHLISAFMKEMRTKASQSFIGSHRILGKNLKRPDFQRIFSNPNTNKDPTSRTLLELLTRIIAQARSFPNLDQYSAELQATSVASNLGKDKRDMDKHVGIPKLIFVCIHTTDRDRDPAGTQHVIATTKENWPKSLPAETKRAWSTRWDRLRDTELIEERTANVWQRVRTKRLQSIPEKPHDDQSWTSSFRGSRFMRRKKKQEQKLQPRKDKEEEERQARTKESVVQARGQAVAELQNEMSQDETSSHRDHDRAAAFHFPACRIAGRCFKCQSLYPFTMHPHARAEEQGGWDQPLNRGERHILQLKGYPAGTCAEDLAYQFCLDVNERYRSRPAATTTATAATTTTTTTEEVQKKK